MVFSSNNFINNVFTLNNLPLSYNINIKSLGIEFEKDINFSKIFIKKFQSVSNFFFLFLFFWFQTWWY
jgi:hypothetical protein